MLFRDQLWAHMMPVYSEILAHPFLTGLTDGSLPRSVFEHYVVQDSHYLRDYARALALCAAKAPDEQTTAMFADHARGCIAVERSMHDEFLKHLGMQEAQVVQAPVLPTTLAYTSYLLRVGVTGSFCDALAAVLPCYWVYARVGEDLLEKSSPDPLYARWIESYGGEEFNTIVRHVLEVVDEVGRTASPQELARAQDHAATSTRYEWMFWDAAWRAEQWPV